jgi:hypothetical protein
MRILRKAYDLAVQGFYKKAVSEEDIRDKLRLIISYWSTCLYPNSKFS